MAFPLHKLTAVRPAFADIFVKTFIEKAPSCFPAICAAIPVCPECPVAPVPGREAFFYNAVPTPRPLSGQFLRWRSSSTEP